MSKQLFLIFFVLLSLLSYSQEIELDSIVTFKARHALHLQSGVIATIDGQLPYWIEANNSGRFKSNNADAFYTIISHESSLPVKKDFRLFLGGEAIATLKGNVDLRFISNYIGFEHKKFKSYVGRFVESFGLNESPLSLGSLVYGNNARPIPKVVLQTNGWQPIPFINSNAMEFKAYIAHGWLEGQRFQSNTYLHQKYLYGRLTLLSERLTLSAGIHHNAQWGGSNLINETSQPTGLNNYLRIFVASPGNSDALQTDQRNALGNHLGNYELSVSYEFKNFIIRSDVQFLWEDSSGLRPSNWADGKLGVQIDFKSQSILKSFLVEAVSTVDQDAVKLREDGSEYLEPDHFFNNSVYRSGWTYNGRVIGSPLFLLVDDFTQDGAVIQNMIRALRVGFSGAWKKLSYQMIYTSFENEGVYAARVDPVFNLSSLDLRLDYSHKSGLDLFTRLNYQDGNWSSQRNFGMQIGFQKRIQF